MPEGRAANQPLAVITLSPPMGAPLPGARVSVPVIGSPARVEAVTISGDSLPSRAFSAGVAGASMRVYQGVPSRSASPRYSSPGSRPVRAVISAASRSRIRPSLSVVHTRPS